MLRSRYLFLVAFTFVLTHTAPYGASVYAQDDLDFSEDLSEEESPAGEELLDEDAEVEEELAAEPQAEEPKLDEPKPEEPKAEDLKAAEPVTDEPKQDDLKAEEPVPEEPKTDTDLGTEPDLFTEEPSKEEEFPTEDNTQFETADWGSSDQPDLSYETQLHDIFVNFHSARTPDAEWASLVGARQSERYNIHTGDNLWNISRTLFGDGNYWPKIWSLNADIKNPHLINPNNVIRFVLGDESEPPAFTVTEAKSEEVAASTGATEGPEGVEVATAPTPKAKAPMPLQPEEDAEPEIPPPLRVSRPVVKKLPPSLPLWQDTALQGGYDSLGIDYGKRKITEVEDTIPLPSYISETIPEYYGRVSEVEVGHNIASAFQYIYVWMKPGEGQVGDTYLAVANQGPVQSVHKSIKGFLGYTIDVQGEVQLVERVTGYKEAKNGEMFRALVLNIVNPVSVDAILTKGQIEKIQVSEDGPRSQVVAQIIGGSFFNRRQIYGNQSIAYLNRGENDGLQEGQVLPVRANRVLRNEDTDVKSNVRPVGWLRIVKTTPRFATGIVVRAWSDVLTGDLTGSGDLLPSFGSARAAAPSESDSQVNDLEGELDNEEESSDVNETENPAEDADFDESSDSDF